MDALSRFAITRRWWVIAAWIVAIVLIQVLLASIGGAKYKDDFTLPGTESQTVSDLLSAAHLSQQNNPTGTLVLRATSGTLAAEPAGFIARATSAVCPDQEAHISGITTPWGSVSCQGAEAADAGTPRPDLLSPDRTVAIVEVEFDVARPADSVPQKVYEDLKPLRSDALRIEFTGDSFTDVGDSTSGVSPEVLGFIAAIVVLALVFRTFGATVLPLLSAVAGLGAGLGLIGLLSHRMSVASFAPSLAELMVIGVGVDYALFIVTRHRRNLLQGMSVQDSIRSALGTSGRAVFFAGITVCIAILGLCALGVSFLYGVAVGTSIAVALTMLASLTLLPAMLTLLGTRVLPRSQRARLKAPNSEPARQPFWTLWANLVERRSTIFGLLAVAILIVVALPFFSLRLGHPDQSNDPAGSTTRKGYDLIQSSFGRGYNSTLQLVIEGPRAGDKAYLEKVDAALSAVPDVDQNSVTPIPVTKTITLVAFKSTSGPQDVATDNLVKNLRDNALPPLYRGTDTKIYVYGTTAVFVDFAKVLSAKMIYFILAVVGLSFLLLMAAFRSVLVPLTAAAMNLLAAGASFGVVVAIFQWGWFSGPLGLGSGGPIDAFLPVLFFAILFGLSMDYQVFLVSRMHEEWIHTRDNHRAVTVGQADTGGIITAAGLIMIMVFASFVLGDGLTIKLLGLGLASAVFLDAFIVRTMLVPAIMHRFGAANWWYPAWLDKITPHISIEAPPEIPAADEEKDEREPIRT